VLPQISNMTVFKIKGAVLGRLTTRSDPGGGAARIIENACSSKPLSF